MLHIGVVNVHHNRASPAFHRFGLGGRHRMRGLIRTDQAKRSAASTMASSAPSLRCRFPPRRRAAVAAIAILSVSVGPHDHVGDCHAAPVDAIPLGPFDTKAKNQAVTTSARARCPIQKPKARSGNTSPVDATRPSVPRGSRTLAARVGAWFSRTRSHWGSHALAPAGA